MAKPATFPTLFDECKTVTIAFLKAHGYLKPDQLKTGTITWSRGEGEHKRITGSISIEVNTNSENPYLELNYKTNDKPISYRVQLVSIPSNIGKGLIWYFLCPNTRRRCRKLYLISGYFLHRKAFTGCFYEKQTYSHKNRKQFGLWGKLFDTDKVYEQIYSKHFKTDYAGKPTKRYLKLLNKIQAANSISKSEVLNLFK
jgi:hypothetical protein